MSSASNISVGIIGAGIIGLACAEELSRRGADLTIYDRRQPGRGASWVAAGMLAPAFEAAAESGAHPDLFELCRRSADLWPEFAARLEAEAGTGTGYSAGPTIAMAHTSGQTAKLNSIKEVLAASGVPFELLDRSALLSLEPELSRDIEIGLALPGDGQVDNRKVIRALAAIFQQRANVRFEIGNPISDPKALLKSHDAIICAAGWESAGFGSAFSTIQPIGGQLLILEKGADAPTHSLRCGSTYIVPKDDRIVVGASVEPGRVSRETVTEVLDELMHSASALYPGLKAAKVLESWAGVRPGTVDHAPIIGQIGEAPIYAATGHYRNGILLAPITAVSIADMVLQDQASPLVQAFRPDRFAASVA